MHNDHHVAHTLDAEDDEGIRVPATEVLAATAAGKRDEAADGGDVLTYSEFESTIECKTLPLAEKEEEYMEGEVKAIMAVTH
jgi:hypothetical protein